jgi:hypothetical protein
MSDHQRLCNPVFSKGSHTVHKKNMKSCMQRLVALYAEANKRRSQGVNISIPNEAEFQSYYALYHLGSDRVQMECLIDAVKSNTLKNPHVVFASKCAVAVSTNDFLSFFRLFKSAHYLQACLLRR